MQQHSKRSSLFLLELILAIGFFCIASAVCVQIFVKSYTIEQESTSLNHAVHLATSAAETFCHSDVEPYEIFYDKDWNICDEENVYYTFKLDIKYDDSLEIAQIRIEAKNSTLYELEVLKNENTGVLL